MDLRSLQEQWDELGRFDPLGAILIEPTLEGPWNPADFFARGEQEIAELLEYGETLGLPGACGSALDFGCGAGRLTQALATRFERAVGVDIAPSMIELANRYNRHGERCRYVLNEKPDLSDFGTGSFDLVYSNLTLQHMSPPLAESYIADFVRILLPGGLLVFQLTSGLEPLPTAAYRGRVELLDPPHELAARASAEVRVRIRNESPHPWPATFMMGEGACPLMVGNHWRDRLRRIVVQDDGRSLLPSDVAPGETAEVGLTVTAPEEPGRYVLEVDLVQQDVAWFANHGSKTARAPVRVGEPAPPAPLEPTAEPATTCGEPGYEMYFVPKARVLEVLGAAGARVIEIVANDSAGPGWVSLRYSATL